MRKTGKTTKYKNGKKEVIHKGFKLPAQLETTLNLDVLNEIINGLDIGKTIDIKGPEQQARQALQRVQREYIESGGTARQLIETANLYQLQAIRLLSEIDFREVNLFEFFLLRQLTARNNERKEPRIKDIAEDILSRRK
jgi:hypothetical protein